MQSVKKLLLILSLFCILISIVLINSHDKGIETGEIASISDLTELDYKQGYYYYGYSFISVSNGEIIRVSGVRSSWLT